MDAPAEVITISLAIGVVFFLEGLKKYLARATRHLPDAPINAPLLRKLVARVKTAKRRPEGGKS